MDRDDKLVNAGQHYGSRPGPLSGEPLTPEQMAEIVDAYVEAYPKFAAHVIRKARAKTAQAAVREDEG